MSDEIKYCCDCAHYRQVDGYHLTDKYYKCEYSQNKGLVKRDVVSKQFPYITCRSMRDGDCGVEGKLFEAK